MAEISAAYAIQNTLAGIQTANGGYLVTATLRGGDYTPSDFLADGLISLVLLAAVPAAVGALVTINRYVGALSRVARQAVMAKGLNRVGPCSEAAMEISRAFQSHNVAGKIIRVETRLNDQHITNGLGAYIYDDGTKQTIGFTGYHEATVVKVAGKDIVYDSIYPSGKAYEQWRKDLVSSPGVELKIIDKSTF